MGARAMEWTLAIEGFLADGEWHPTADALAAGAAVVPDERALREMGDKKASAPTEERLQIGKRNVAQQGLTGLVRFGKVEYGDGRKQVRKVSDRSFSIGEFNELRARVEQLEESLESILGQLESQQTQLDRLDNDADASAAEFLQAAGVNSSTS